MGQGALALMYFSSMKYRPPIQAQRPPQQPQTAPLHGALKYQNPEIAAAFDAKREHDPKRVISKNAVKAMLDDMPPGTRVVDAGCGTGLMFEFFVDKRFIACGIDLSEAQLGEAAKKLHAFKAAGRLKANFTLGVGSVLQLQLEPKCCDASVMIDLTRWLSPDECQQAMRELLRITKSRIIWTARVANHREARTVELFEQVLTPASWRVTRNVAGIDTDYRILMAEPA